MMRPAAFVSASLTRRTVLSTPSFLLNRRAVLPGTLSFTSQLQTPAATAAVALSSTPFMFENKRFSSVDAASAAAAAEAEALASSAVASGNSSSLASAAATDSAAAAAAEAASSVAAASVGGGGAPVVVPTPTLVRAMDNIWSTIANTVSNIIPDVSPFLDFGVNALVATQATLGLPWSTVFLLFGIAVRASTLYFTMYGERASLRMQIALPELKEVYHKFELVYYNPASTTRELQDVSNTLKEQQRKVYKKHGTSNRASLVSLMSGPIFVYGFWVAMRTTGSVPEVAATSWNWISSLAVPDPYFVLPCAVIGMTVVNFELLFQKKGGATGTGISSNLVAAVRVAALSCLWVVSNFRSAVLLYWAGVSCTGLLQPLLMNSAWFQKLFNVPSDADLKSAVEQARMAQKKAHDATVGCKSPTQSFIDKLKETRAEAKSGFSLNQPSSSSSQQKVPKMTGAAAVAAAGAPSSSSSEALSSSPLAYRIRKASDVQKKQQQQKSDSDDDVSMDPLMQRFKMAMPSVAQGVADPEKVQKLADDIQSYNEDQMEEARKQRSWKSKRK